MIHTLQTNTSLFNLYNEYKSKTLPSESSLSRFLSAPLLLKVSPTWETSKQKILIVGQETQGWYGTYFDFMHGSNSVEELMNRYEEFCFAKNSSHRLSPLWNAFRTIADKKLNEISFDSNVIWTNLVRSDYKRGSVYRLPEQQRKEVFATFTGLLSAEINILKPDKILFFSGPRYDERITNELQTTEWRPCDPTRPERQIATFIVDQKIPALRTYHPAYLRRSKNWHIIDTICYNFTH